MAPPTAKSGNMRRVSSSLSKVSTPSSAAPGRPPKNPKPSKIVKLKLSKEVLLAVDQHSTASPSAHLAAPAPSTPERDTTSSQGRGGDGTESPANDVNREDQVGHKTGTKRELGAGIESDNPSKPKANPRKRPRVGENGRIDGRTAAAKAMGYSAASHKLGPKANQGAINEKLRALDRTGKACRRWQRTGFKIKSFTGKVWELPTWRTPNSRAFGSSADSQRGTSNDLSKANSSSNVGSDENRNGENTDPISSTAALVTPSSA